MVALTYPAFIIHTSQWLYSSFWTSLFAHLINNRNLKTQTSAKLPTQQNQTDVKGTHPLKQTPKSHMSAVAESLMRQD
jgi:hypothetical protein